MRPPVTGCHIGDNDDGLLDQGRHARPLADHGLQLNQGPGQIPGASVSRGRVGSDQGDIARHYPWGVYLPADAPPEPQARLGRVDVFFVATEAFQPYVPDVILGIGSGTGATVRVLGPWQRCMVPAVPVWSPGPSGVVFDESGPVTNLRDSPPPQICHHGPVLRKVP